MSEWANLTLEQKLVTPPVRKTAPDFPTQIRYDMEWKTELGEQQELQAIHSDVLGSGRVRWLHMVHEEKIKSTRTENR